MTLQYIPLPFLYLHLFRWNTSQAYLRPVLKRKNLQADVKAFTTRILFENNRAIGVEYHHDNQIRRARATKEVILCGGAINSPQLLMVSGVGNGDELKKLGIPVVANRPGVGQNLQDHLEMHIQHVSDECFDVSTERFFSTERLRFFN